MSNCKHRIITGCLGVITLVFPCLSSQATIGLLSVPEVATDCKTNKVLELPGVVMYGAGPCSDSEYRQCVSACVDQLLPWRVLQSVNCSHVQQSRSYAVAVCECNEASEFPPLQPGGPRSPIDVGYGLY